MTKTRKFMCNVLGWHSPDRKIVLTGINLKSTCQYCGRPILRDSQGNWFAYGTEYEYKTKDGKTDD